MKKQTSLLLVSLLVVISFLLPEVSLAAGIGDIAAAVDFSAAGTALIAVFAAAAGLGLLFAGGSIIVRKVFSGGK